MKLKHGLTAVCVAWATNAAAVVQPPVFSPATVNWLVSGATFPPYAVDHSNGYGTGTHVAQVGGVTLATVDNEYANAPYIRAEGRVGYDGYITDYVDRAFAYAAGGISYQFVIRADSPADAQTLIDYMATIAPLRDDPNRGTGTRWGLGANDLDGASFVNVSSKTIFPTVGSAKIYVQGTEDGSPFYADTVLNRGCSNQFSDSRPCDGFDSNGAPILQPFTLHTAVVFDSGSLDFYGSIYAAATAGGTESYIVPLFTATAIVDPVLRLSAGFTGNRSHYTLFLPDGLGNGPPPSTVPEPATWLLLIGGIGLTGLSLRRRRSLAMAHP